MNFDIKTEQLGDDAYVISLAGEVDLYTAPETQAQLRLNPVGLPPPTRPLHAWDRS